MNNVMKEYRPGKYAAGNVQNRPIYQANRPAPKRRTIADRLLRFCRSIFWGRLALLCLVAVGVGLYALLIVLIITGEREAPAEIQTPAPLHTVTVKAEPQVVEYVFHDGEGHPVDMKAASDAWAQSAGLYKRYDLTDAERWEIASVVTAEAAGEPYAGKMAVAQCILQACEDDGIRPTEAVVKYVYAKKRPEPTEEAMDAVRAVFDFGQVVTSEPIKYFYAPARVTSAWHESQAYVMTINGHKFFAEVKR